LLSESGEAIELQELSGGARSTVDSGLRTGARSSARNLLNDIYRRFIGKQD
jgi:hypothetical protein